MTAIVYILQSTNDGKTYVGSTISFKRRLRQHNSGQVKSTKYRFPFNVIFTEEYDSLKEARKREAWWKSGAGRRKMKELFTK